MIGLISKAFVESLRASQLVADENISIVLANDNGEIIINTPWPAVAISVLGDNDNTGTYLGGLINLGFNVQVIVITEFANISASHDNDYQYNQMDLSYKIMLVLNKAIKGSFFTELRNKYDFQGVFDDIKTEITRGMHKDLGERDIYVHRLYWKVNMLATEILDDRPSIVLPSGGVHIDCKSGQVKIGDLPSMDPNKADS